MKQKIVLIAAIVAGLLAAVLTRFYLSAKDAEIDGGDQNDFLFHGAIVSYFGCQFPVSSFKFQ